MNSRIFSNVFPLGCHLCREPMPPMGELKQDMERLKRQGFNLIKLQEHWMIDEPVEGRYDFSRYEELIDHAALLDLGVYLGLTCEQAPPWLYRKYPDCRMVGRDGVPIAYEAPSTLPADGKPGPCFDHPGAMADQILFITRLVETLGRFENIVVWNTWQEIGYWADMLVGTSVCFCPHTLAAFQEWLAGRFGDLDSLNRAWNTRYAAWDDILPSRNGAAKGPYAVDMCWQYFMDNVQVPRVLRARADAIRSADPHDRPVFAHVGFPVVGAGQNWSHARTQDFVGSSCYPAWGCGHAWDDGFKRPFAREYALLGETWDNVALRCDYIRSCNRPGSPVWMAEFQGGPVSTGFQKGRVPSPEDIRRWMLTAVGCGVTGISFWVARAEIMASEQNGFSLLDSVGDTTPRFEEAGRIGRALNAHADIFGQPTLAPSEVGIIVDEMNFQLCTLMDQAAEHLSYDLRGWHRMLWEMNIPVDFLDTAHDLDRIAQYKSLILPFPLSVSEEVAEKLAEYVESGGHLISEAAPGRIDENGFCNRGEMSPTLASLFGVRQADFVMVREPDGVARWSPPERTWGEYREVTVLNGVHLLAGHNLRANVYLQTFACDGGTPVLLADDAVAGTVRQAGAGRAWLLGTYVGHGGTAYRTDETRECIRALLAECGVFPSHVGALLVRKRVTPGKEAWIFTNPTAEPVMESINVAEWAHVEDLFSGPVAKQEDCVVLTVEPLGVRVLLLFVRIF